MKSEAVSHAHFSAVLDSMASHTVGTDLSPSST